MISKGGRSIQLGQGWCQKMLVEQVLRLQVDKLAMIVSYTSGKNSALVVLSKQRMLLCDLNDLMFVHVSPQSL